LKTKKANTKLVIEEINGIKVWSMADINISFSE
jgi:hypothetical protein